MRHELARDLTRETAWEAVMRVRCGKGQAIHDVSLIFNADADVHLCLRSSDIYLFLVFTLRSSLHIVSWELYAEVHRFISASSCRL